MEKTEKSGLTFVQKERKSSQAYDKPTNALQKLLYVFFSKEQSFHKSDYIVTDSHMDLNSGVG